MSGNSLADKINMDDFKKLKHYVVFRNETSGTNFLNAQEVDFQGIEDEVLYLMVPKSSCQVGHIIHAVLMPKKPEKPMMKFPKAELHKGWVALVGKIFEMDHMSKDKISIQLKINQFNMQDVKDIGEKYERRQKQINDLMDKGD
jgi:hypothetical protein